MTHLNFTSHLIVKIFCFLYVSLIVFKMTSARFLRDSPQGFVNGHLYGVNSQHKHASEFRSTKNLQEEVNLDPILHTGTDHKLRDLVDDSEQVTYSKTGLKDALLVLGAAVKQNLKAEEEKLSNEINKFDEIECGNNDFYLSVEMLLRPVFHQERAIDILQDFMEQYAVHHSNTHWSLFSSRYREDLDAYFIPLLQEFTEDGAAVAQHAGSPAISTLHTQNYGRTGVQGEQEHLKFNFTDSYVVRDSNETKSVLRRRRLTKVNKLQEESVAARPASSSSGTLSEILKSHLGHVHLTTAALEHVMLGDALVGERLLLGRLHKILGELGRLSRQLSKCLSHCGEVPLQGPIQRVLTTDFEQFDYSGRVSRGVRTLRHTVKMLKYFKKSLLDFQKENNREFFAEVLSDLIL